MRIPSGKIDQVIFFVAVDSTDLKTRKTGLSSFTVYRSRNGAAATVYTTPTVSELSAANMPGVYSLLVDEDTTIASTSDSEEYCVHITQASMAPVTRTIELYRRPVTTGETITTSGGVANANVERLIGTPVSVVGGRQEVHVGSIADAIIAFRNFTQTYWDGISAYVWGVSVGSFGTVSDAFGGAIAEIWDRVINRLDAATSTLATSSAVASIQTDTDDIQNRLPAALVGGRIDASVGAMQNNVVTAAAIAADAIGASELAADAVAEIQSGLATAASVASIQADTDDIQSRLPAGLINGRIDANVGSVSDGILTFAKFAENFWQGLVDRVWGASVGSYGTISDAFGGAVAEIWTRVMNYLDAATSTHATAAALATAQADLDDIQARLPAALVGGRIDASVGAMQNNVVTAAAIAADAIGASELAADAVAEIQSGLATSAAVAAVQADTDDIQSRLPLGLVGGRIDAHVGSAADGVFTFAKFGETFWQGLTDRIWGASVGAYGTISDAFGGAVAEIWTRVMNYLDVAVSTRQQSGISSAPTAAEVADAVWDEATAGHVAAGSFGANVDAAISSRASAASVAAVNADTDDIQNRLPAGLINGRIDAHVGSIADGILTFAKFAENYWQGMTDRIWSASVGAYGTVSDAFGGAIAEIWSRVSALLDVPVSTRAAPGDAMDLVIDALDANAVAASGAAEIQAGLATSAAVAGVQTDVDDIQSRLPAGLIAGRIDAHVGSVADGILTPAKFSTTYFDAITDRIWGASVGAYGTISDAFGGAIAEIWSRVSALLDVAVSTRLASSSYVAPSTPPTAAEIADAVWDEQTSGHQVAGSTGKALTDAGTGSASVDVDAVAQAVWAYAVGPFVATSDSFGEAINEIRIKLSTVAADVWDVTLAAHLSAGSTGFALNAAGSAGDPWGTALPGAYGAGTAGFIIGTNLNATVSSRLASAAYTAPDNLTIASISARLPAALVNGRIDAHIGSIADGVITFSKHAQDYWDGISAYVWNVSVGQFGNVSDAYGGAVAEMWSRLSAYLDVAVSTRLATSGYTAPTAPPSSAEIADAVWDEPLAAHLSAGSTGNKLNSGSTVDSDSIAQAVWGYAVGPFVLVSDSFGEAISEIRTRTSNLDAPVSSRLAAASYTAPDNASIAAIKLKTDNLPASPAATGDIPTAVQNADALLARNLAGGSNGGRDVTSALRILRNKMLISGTTLTVYQEDDLTPAWTSTLATDATALPIVGSDPS